jgi:hypothetical protein
VLPGFEGTFRQASASKPCLEQLGVLQRTLRVRFGALADITSLNYGVRFTPESGHRSALRSAAQPITGGT